MVVTSVTSFVVWLPVVVSIRVTGGKRDDMVCSVREVPTHYQYGISFAFATPGVCNLAKCNDRNFFRDYPAGEGLEDFFVATRKPNQCQCSVNEKYWDGNNRTFISYSEQEGEEKESRCTARTCWDHYSSLRYFIGMKTQKLNNLEDPGNINHWEFNCVDPSTMAPGVKIESVSQLLRKLKNDGYESVIEAAQHLFVKEEEPSALSSEVSAEEPSELSSEVFAGGFKLDDPVWSAGIEILVSNGEIVKYGTEGKIVGGGPDDQSVTVQFANCSLTDLVIPVEALSRVALSKCFAGGFCVDDVAYYRAEKKISKEGLGLASDSKVVVVAPDVRDHSIEKVFVKCGEEVLSVDVRSLSKTKTAPEDPLLVALRMGSLM